MPEGDQDQRCIAVTIAPILGGLDQLLYLFGSQVFPLPQLRIGRPEKNCYGFAVLTGFRCAAQPGGDAQTLTIPLLRIPIDRIMVLFTIGGKPCRLRLPLVLPVHDRNSSRSSGFHNTDRPLVEALSIGVATLRSALRMAS